MPVFLDKSHADLKAFVATAGELSAAEFLHVTPQYVEATNGRVLLRVPLYPVPLAEEKGSLSDPTSGHEVLLNPDTLEGAFRHVKRKKGHVRLSEDQDNVVLHVEGEKFSLSLKEKKGEGIYPDTEVVLSWGSPCTVTLNAYDLKLIAEWVCKHASSYGGVAPLRLYIEGPCKTVHFVAPVKQAKGALSPVSDKASM
jgi:hypothetical protein